MTRTKRQRLKLRKTSRDEERRARRIAVFSLFALLIFGVTNFVVVSIWGESILGGFPEDTPAEKVAVDAQNFDSQ